MFRSAQSVRRFGAGSGCGSTRPPSPFGLPGYGAGGVDQGGAGGGHMDLGAACALLLLGGNPLDLVATRQVVSVDFGGSMGANDWTPATRHRS